jgi:hypothetical protein
MLRRLLIPIVVVLASVVVATPADASADRRGPTLKQVVSATAKFRSVGVAQRAGYGRFVDVNGVACIDMPGMGAMGIHYVNGDLVADPTISALKPEAMVYEPTRSGGLRLVAVEYVVVKADWDAKHRSRPSLFGRRFDLTNSPNRYGLPPFYSLHAWVWKANPAGTFAMWNPRVHCPSTDPHAGHGAHHSGA